MFASPLSPAHSSEQVSQSVGQGGTSAAVEARAFAHFSSRLGHSRATAILATGERLRTLMRHESASSPASVPGASWLTITDYNVSSDGSADVSAVIDTIGRSHMHGTVLVLPGSHSKLQPN